MNAPAPVKRSSGNGMTPSAHELYEQGERVRDEVVALAAAVRQATRGGQALIRQRLEAQPYATLAIAAGVGYVLGGGVPGLLLRGVVGFGGRLALEQAFARLVTSNAPQS